MESQILLITRSSARVLPRALRNEGYAVAQELDGRSGWRRAIDERFDALIVDAALSKEALELCMELRRLDTTLPLIVLVPPRDSGARIQALRLGADDCLEKPVDIGWFLARLEALLRRCALPQAVRREGALRVGGLEVDTQRGLVRRSGQRIELSPREYALLLYLMQHPHRVHSREELLQEVWGFQRTPDTRTIDVHVSWLRQKVEADPRHPRHIMTVRGLGYRFCPHVDSSCATC